ncbi:anthranilate synthase component I [Agaribacterium haliotis]|uniref:anthranilate synthase component I n=1 Tax=Agaribacterium haliotis TaxID=2013869 RepID=UPI000BB54DF1|nr:anthranilate synthase component I [Agaribacterium haliotis]
MNKEQFQSLAEQGYNRIPVLRTILADTETPLSAYLKLAAGPYSYLFESVQGGEKWGRYSIIGLPASERVEITSDNIVVKRQGQADELIEASDPLSFVSAYQQRFKVPEKAPGLDGLPNFYGGLVGYFAYDAVRFIESRLAGGAAQDELNVPDILLMVSDEVLVFDNLQGKIHLVVNVDPSADNAFAGALARIETLRDKLESSVAEADRLAAGVDSAKTLSETQFESSFGRANFMQSVDKIKDYILAGDTMQVVLSQRMSGEFTAKPINLYRALRSLNPSPYMYFMDLGDYQIVGSSPEILARLENGEVTVRPIAGTRRRGYTEEEDLALEKELINDPKEIAEHLMLIDLGRNDVGRVAEVGSVKLTEKMMVERFSHVLHITSNVIGQIKPELDAMDVLKASLPAGTLSGAPKIRAMEIIDELEPVKRGIYGGAVGYLSWHGNLDMAIAIRTAVIKDGRAHVQAGAGVVADSVPELEWKETMNKARALFGAIDWVNKS